MHAGVDIQAVIHDLPTFVSSFDYSLASQAFLQRPAAAGRMAHLETLTVHHTAEALQIHGSSLLDQAQQAVSDLVDGHLQQLCEVLRQQEVITVLEAARAAIRAAAEAEGQGLVALSPNEDAQSSQEAASIRRDEDAGAHRSGQEQSFSSADDSDEDSSWLQQLTGAQLVEHAEMVQAGLQRQQLTGSHQSCLGQIEGLVTGKPVRSPKGCVLQCSPVASCPVWLCSDVSCCAACDVKLPEKLVVFHRVGGCCCIPALSFVAFLTDILVCRVTPLPLFMAFALSNTVAYPPL